MKLQSILFPQKNTCENEAMYFHREDNCLIFDGYFNLFYLEKHHRYCEIDSLTLELLVEGEAKITLMHDKDEIGSYEADGENSPTRLSIDLPYDKYESGVFYFKAEPLERSVSFSLTGHYEGRAKRISPVNIAVNIC